MRQVTIYVTPLCPRCKQLEAQLDAWQVPYEVKDLSRADVITDFRLEGYFGLVGPILQVGSRFYGPGELFVGDGLNEEKIRKALEEQV